MDKNVWILVEYVEEQSVFSNYGIINSNNLMHRDTDIHNGIIVLVRDKNNGARKAQILRMSESKRYVKDLKVMLERQDNQVKNVLSLCMNTIKGMKSGSMLLDQNQSRPLPCNALDRICQLPDQLEISSDSESEVERHNTLNLQPTPKHYFQSRRSEPTTGEQMSRLLNDKTIFKNRKPLKSSTPLPDRCLSVNVKVFCDKATQTDPELYPPINKIEQLETVLRRLYGRFLKLMAEVEIREKQKQSAIRGTENCPEESVIKEPINVAVQYLANAGFELHQNKANVLQVRRASAQTTNTGLVPIAENNEDMVAIGNGNATIPARLWANMDWSSHTSATRQLLQAVFPRRVLATHSLSGKQSPAFADRPPKQQLDPKLVDDIVYTVSERCGVPKRIVRSIITTKCTDEAKLYRNRMQQRKREQSIPENISPLPSSNESSNTRD